MNPTKKASLYIQLGIFLLGISASIYVSITPANSMMNWYSNDDAFFYYKVAQNVLNGHGFTFDRINLTNGFHPLWMVVCLGVFWLSRFHLLLPLRVLIVVSGVINGFTGIILYRLLKRFVPHAAAVLGAAVWMLLPTIYHNYTSRGLESVLSAFFIALLLLIATSIHAKQSNATKKDYLLLGVVAALTILSRLDTLFVVLMIGFFVVFRITRIPRIVIFDLVAILLMSIVAWIIRFGTTPTVLNHYSLYPPMIISMVITPLVLVCAGIYSTGVKWTHKGFILRVLIAGLLSVIIEVIVLELLRRAGLNILVSKTLVVIETCLTFIVFGITRFFLPSSIRTPLDTTWIKTSDWLHNGLSKIFVNGLLFALPLMLFIGGYMVMNKLTFGTATPISGQVKTWWGTLDNTVYRQHDTLISLLGLSPGRSGDSPWGLATTPIADITLLLQRIISVEPQELSSNLFLILLFIAFMAGVFLLSRKNGLLARRSFSLLLPAVAIGCLLHIAYYAARGYGHTRSWYWVPQSMLLVLLGAVIVSSLFDKFKKWTTNPLPETMVTLAMVCMLIFMQTRYIIKLFPASVPLEKQAAYLEEIRDLEKHTNEKTLIGMTGGGLTAYFIQNRTIVNLDGLINSKEYFNSLRDGTAHLFLDNMGLDYVYGNSYMLLESDPYQQIFSGRIGEIGMIHGEMNFTLYRFGSP